MAKKALVEKQKRKPKRKLRPKRRPKPKTILPLRKLRTIPKNHPAKGPRTKRLPQSDCSWSF